MVKSKPRFSKPAFKQPDTRIWLAVVGSALIVLGTAYVLVQQSNRLGAYDQPVALNQIVRHRLDNGVSSTAAVLTQPASLRDNYPFAIITDSKLQVQASSTLSGTITLLPPKGTFDYAKAHGQDRFTWQPTPGVRVATIITSYKNGSQYVLTGQSLKEAEYRIAIFTALVFLGMLAVLTWATVVLSWQRR